MTPQDAMNVLDFLKRSTEDRLGALRQVTEQHSDYADRVIAQAAQLKILNEHGSPVEILQALRGVAASGNPL